MVGLGRMGANMTRRLVRSGHEVVAYDVDDDAVRAVAGKPVTSLADFYRAIWSLGEAGVDVPLTLDREGDVFDVRITSADRARFLKSASLH